MDKKTTRKTLLKKHKKRANESQIRDIARFKSGKEQFYQAAGLLYQVFDESKSSKEKVRLLYEEIVLQKFFKQWEESLKEKLNLLFQILTDWYDFYFSYSNRQAEYINRKYSEMVSKSHFVQNIIENKVQHHLAHVIVKLLLNNNLTGFYDRIELTTSDPIKEEITKNCARSLSFVQIIDNISFTWPESNGENWCHNEYISYALNDTFREISKKAILKNYHFIRAEDPLTLPANPAEYNEWISEVNNIKGTSVSEIDYLELCKRIKEIANSIVRFKKSIIEMIVVGNN